MSVSFHSIIEPEDVPAKRVSVVLAEEVEEVETKEGTWRKVVKVGEVWPGRREEEEEEGEGREDESRKVSRCLNSIPCPAWGKDISSLSSGWGCGGMEARGWGEIW